MVEKGEFFLKGYFNKQSFTFLHDKQTITISANIEKVARLEIFNKEVDELSETGTLTISGSNDKEELRDLAVDIKNLLSIGLGKRIIFDRQTYWTGEFYQTVKKEMSKNQNQGEPIIPDFEIRNYLETTLPNWTKYTKQVKDEIYIVTDYLNQTNHDFIEDRILRTVQAWECAAHYWVIGVDLSDELKELKEKIKDTYLKWKKDKNYADQDGEIGKRLTNALDQEKLMLRLEKLVTESGLNKGKINLDLKSLKNLRDSVAHTGRIKIKGPEAIKILQSGVFGLQLILLKRIGYNGFVNGEKDNWKTFDKIIDYFE